MSASLEKVSNILQNFDSSVTYVEQFDLTPCCTWEDDLGVCLSSEGIDILLSNISRMVGQGWVYMYTTQEPHDEAIFKLHYQAPLN